MVSVSFKLPSIVQVAKLKKDIIYQLSVIGSSNLLSMEHKQLIHIQANMFCLYQIFQECKDQPIEKNIALGKFIDQYKNGGWLLCQFLSPT